MSETKLQLRAALLTTAQRLRAGRSYQWGHFGACNCGQLAQTLTRRTPAEIHRAALERAASWAAPAVDDWGDAAVEYCPTSGLPLDEIVSEMLAAGLTLQQIRDLEQLADPLVLRRLGASGSPDEGGVRGPRRHLRRNSREDLVCYLEAWAALLGDELACAEPLAAE